MNEECGACGAEPGEKCHPHCIAVDSILNGIEDATNLANGGQTAG